MGRFVHRRGKRRLGPVGVGGELGLPTSTVHAVLTRVKLSRLHYAEVRPGNRIRRYEHDKARRYDPAGGSSARTQGGKNRRTTPGKPHRKTSHELIGTASVHTVIDDRSRVAYAKVHEDEAAATAIRVFRPERPAGSPPAASLSNESYPYRPQTNGKIERFHRVAVA